ncbi:MAG: hypothetical protein RIR17_133 [Planctomycetota bacterium]|jgi:hypothetical protein
MKLVKINPPIKKGQGTITLEIKGEIEPLVCQKASIN